MTNYIKWDNWFKVIIPIWHLDHIEKIGQLQNENEVLLQNQHRLKQKQTSKNTAFAKKLAQVRKEYDEVLVDYEQMSLYLYSYKEQHECIVQLLSIPNASHTHPFSFSTHVILLHQNLMQLMHEKQLMHQKAVQLSSQNHTLEQQIRSNAETSEGLATDIKVFQDKLENVTKKFRKLQSLHEKLEQSLQVAKSGEMKMKAKLRKIVVAYHEMNR